MPAKSIRQRNLFALVSKCQKTGDCASDKILKIASSISHKAASDYAATDTKNLPDKVEVDMSFSNYIKIEEKKNNCECTCAACIDGNCGGCTCENCTCKGCSCNSKS
jgi:hypothetical protein